MLTVFHILYAIKEKVRNRTVKRIWLLLLCLCLALPAAALGDSHEPMMLYSASFAAMQVTGGVYVPLTMKDGDLRSGPGGKYSNVGPFTMNNREAHCYTLACDQLTPDMIAQLYNDCEGLWGPGDSYDQLAGLPVDVTEGTLILTQGEWGLLELNEYTLECIDAYAPMRVWVRLGNCFY